MAETDPVRDVDALVALRREIELRWTGEFADNAVNTLDAAATTITALQAEVAAQMAALDRLAEVASKMLSDFIARGAELEAMEALLGPLDDVGAEATTALTSEGIYVWGPDGERFECMFNVVMASPALP